MIDDSFLSDKRKERLKSVIEKRQFDLTIVLENIHDPHNIGAVMRTCDAVGIHEIYVILSDSRVDEENYLEINNHTSSGSRKWVQVHIFEDVETAMQELRKKYTTIVGTHLSTEAKSLYDLDLCESTALVFGNEHSGISEQLLEKLDGNFIIPQVGMVQSLNISVACAISVYEAMRQRIQNKGYQSKWKDNHKDLYEKYVKNSKPKLFE